MKKTRCIGAAAAAFIALASASCSLTGGQAAPDLPAAIPEGSPVSISDDAAPLARWTELTHRSVASIAAAQWGLSAARAQNISDASDDPDTYQSGLENAYNQQWSHAYLYDDTFGSTYWLWGDADDDFNDNLNGPSGGEGYNGSYAGAFYASANQRGGDRYLGYALHYIEDVSLVLHSTAPTSLGITVPYKTTDMLTHHFDFEAWVQNNLNSGWNLLSAVQADPYYYAVTDLKAAIRNAAWTSCAYKGTSSIGYAAWTAYRSAGYPTAAGSGSAALAANAKAMLVNSGRYAKGAIKYCLDHYGQWTNKY